MCTTCVKCLELAGLMCDECRYKETFKVFSDKWTWRFGEIVMTSEYSASAKIYLDPKIS